MNGSSFFFAEGFFVSFFMKRYFKFLDCFKFSADCRSSLQLFVFSFVPPEVSGQVMREILKTKNTYESGAVYFFFTFFSAARALLIGDDFVVSFSLS
jgi:hypothetical protein